MLKEVYSKQEISEIKSIIKNQFTIHLGKDIAQFYINNKECGNDFLIIISNQAKKSFLPFYEAALQKCINNYCKRKDYYLYKTKLSLEQMLKYCIITNDIKIAGFVQLNNCRVISSRKLTILGTPGSGKVFQAILPESSLE